MMWGCFWTQVLISCVVYVASPYDVRLALVTGFNFICRLHDCTVWYSWFWSQVLFHVWFISPYYAWLVLVTGFISCVVNFTLLCMVGFRHRFYFLCGYVTSPWIAVLVLVHNYFNFICGLSLGLAPLINSETWNSLEIGKFKYKMIIIQIINLFL